ncbi:MAG: tetratricopeptide repeat protein [Cyclobacteriaceae bacterium]
MNAERIKLLEKYREEEPNNPFNQYALAMEHYLEDSKKAMSLLNDLRTNHPEYLPTYFKLAHLYWDIEKWEEAASVFESGIKLAEKQEDQKALSELKSAHQNFQFEKD